MIKKPQEPADLKDVHRFQEDLYNNLSMDDVKNGNLKTEVPTTDDLEIGRFRVVEISGVPTLYHRATNGNIYLIATGTPI